MTVPLYKCEDCNSVVADIERHIEEKGHTKGYTPLNEILPAAPEPTVASRLRPVMAGEPLPDLPCPDCGRIMTQDPLAQDQCLCEEHGTWKKEYALEALKHQGGKPKREYSPSGKEWASWRKTGRLSRGQKLGLTFMLAGSLLLVILVYLLFFTHRWVF